MSTNVYTYCPHCGYKLNEEEIANATGFCHKEKCQEKAGNI